MTYRGNTTLTKAETVALWHAVDWMHLCLREQAKVPHEQAALEAERKRLKLAKQALRKVNRIRKSQTGNCP